MLAAIMQPTYIPWMGYFGLISEVDMFVFYDDVQVVKGSWGVRNRIKTSKGEIYLTVSINKTGTIYNTFFNNAKINYTRGWERKHLSSVEQNYKKAPFFKDVFPIYSEVINKQHVYLADLNIHFIEKVTDYLGFKVKFIRSSSLKDTSGKKDVRLVNICKEINADQYLSPQGSSVYIEAEKPAGVFPENDIQLYYQNFVHPEYPQLYGDFISHMSVLDLLFNCGKEKSADLILQGEQEKIPSKVFREKYLQNG